MKSDILIFAGSFISVFVINSIKFRKNKQVFYSIEYIPKGKRYSAIEVLFNRFVSYTRPLIGVNKRFIHILLSYSIGEKSKVYAIRPDDVILHDDEMVYINSGHSSVANVFEELSNDQFLHYSERYISFKLYVLKEYTLRQIETNRKEAFDIYYTPEEISKEFGIISLKRIMEYYGISNIETFKQIYPEIYVNYIACELGMCSLFVFRPLPLNNNLPVVTTYGNHCICKFLPR